MTSTARSTARPSPPHGVLGQVSGADVRAALAERHPPGAALALLSHQLASACLALARRFHRGGKLIVFGNGGGSTDAQHIAVEFVHPVIVGKRALPALSLTNDPSILTGISSGAGFSRIFADQIMLLADPQDIALGVSADGSCQNVLAGLAVARELGLLTVGLAGGGGGQMAEPGQLDHCLVMAADDPELIKEVQVTTYHMLWELTHVFLEQPGLIELGSTQ